MRIIRGFCVVHVVLPILLAHLFACACDEKPECVLHVNGALGEYTGHDGSSWTLAFANVQEGIDAVAARIAEGDYSSGEVWVAAGTYCPTQDTDGNASPSDPMTLTIQLRSGVALYGGFAGNETSLEKRDIASNETILSGEISIKDDVIGRSYHVVTGADDALMDGFTVTRGNANEPAPNSKNTFGGGMFNENASPTIKNCIFVNNRAGYCDQTGDFDGECIGGGGGMYNKNSSPFVVNCIFQSNDAAFEGGGMLNKSGSSPEVINTLFENNSAFSSLEYGEDTDVDVTTMGIGGAMMNLESTPTVTNCTFVRNSAKRGGCIYSNESALVITNSIVWGNDQLAGGSVIFGGGIVTHSDIQGGGTVASGSTADETGNIDADPLYINTNPSMGDVDYRVQPGSPCIDTGLSRSLPADVTTDLDGHPRILGAAVDMGAYERQ